MSLIHLLLQLFIPPEPQVKKSHRKIILPDGTTKSVYRKINDRSLNYVTLDKNPPKSLVSAKNIKLRKPKGEPITKRNPPLKIYNAMGEVIHRGHPDWGNTSNHLANQGYQEKKYERQQFELRKKYMDILVKCAPPLPRKEIDLNPRQKYWLEKELEKTIFKNRKFPDEKALEDFMARRRKKLAPTPLPARTVSKRDKGKTRKTQWSAPSTKILKDAAINWVKEDNRRILIKNSSPRPKDLETWKPQDIYSLYLDFRSRNKYSVPEVSFKTLDHTDFMRKVTLNYVLFEQEITAGKYTYLFGKTHHHNVFNKENFKIQTDYSMNTEYQNKQFFSFLSPDWLIRFHPPGDHPVLIDHSITINYMHDYADGDPFMLTYFSPHQSMQQGWNALKIPPKKDMSTADMNNTIPIMIQFLRDMKIPFKIYPCSILQAVQPEAQYSKEEVAELKAEYEKKYVDWELIKIESTRLYVKLITSMAHTLTNKPDPYEGKALYSQEWRDYANGPMGHVRLPEVGGMRFHVDHYYELSYSDRIIQEFRDMPRKLLQDFILGIQITVAGICAIELGRRAITPRITPELRAIWEKFGKAPRFESKIASLPRKTNKIPKKSVQISNTISIQAALLDSPNTSPMLLWEFLRRLKTAGLDRKTREMSFEKFIQLPDIQILLQPLMVGRAITYNLMHVVPNDNPIWGRTKDVGSVLKRFNMGMKINTAQIGELLGSKIDD
ncbi:MAG: hypothetical protein ACTSRK_17985, partial [Promethearchaeota archaeon]